MSLAPLLLSLPAPFAGDGQASAPPASGTPADAAGGFLAALTAALGHAPAPLGAGGPAATPASSCIPDETAPAKRATPSAMITPADDAVPDDEATAEDGPVTAPAETVVPPVTWSDGGRGAAVLNASVAFGGVATTDQRQAATTRVPVAAPQVAVVGPADTVVPGAPSAPGTTTTAQPAGAPSAPGMPAPGMPAPTMPAAAPTTAPPPARASVPAAAPAAPEVPAAPTAPAAPPSPATPPPASHLGRDVAADTAPAAPATPGSFAGPTATSVAGPAAPPPPLHERPVAPAAVVQQVFPEVTRLSRSGNGTHRLTITLQPEQLGEVRVTLVVRDGTVRVNLASEQAKDILAQAAPELRRLLEQSGATDARIVVRDAGQTLADSTTADAADRRHADHAGDTRDEPGGRQSGGPRDDRPGARHDAGLVQPQHPIRRATTADSPSPSGRLDRLM